MNLFLLFLVYFDVYFGLMYDGYLDSLYNFDAIQIGIWYNNILGKYFLNRFYFFHYDFGYKNSF